MSWHRTRRSPRESPPFGETISEPNTWRKIIRVFEPDAGPEVGVENNIGNSQWSLALTQTNDQLALAGIKVPVPHHPSWGAKKLLKILRKKHPRWSWPHRGTVCEILSRHGLVPHKRRRRLIGHPGKPTTQILAPNDVWSADFRGQFKTTHGTYCYPLTVTDGYSRFLLRCQALRSTSVAEAKPVFLRLFQEFGLPRRIRTDNGVPFATNTLGRLSQLSAWWVQLGVLPEFIKPSKPQFLAVNLAERRVVLVPQSKVQSQAWGELDIIGEKEIG